MARLFFGFFFFFLIVFTFFWKNSLVKLSQSHNEIDNKIQQILFTYVHSILDKIR